MMTHREASGRFWWLVDESCNGSLDSDGDRELQALLVANPQLRQLYLNYCHLHAGLFLAAKDKQVEADDLANVPVSESSAIGTARRRMVFHVLVGPKVLAGVVCSVLIAYFVGLAVLVSWQRWSRNSHLEAQHLAEAPRDQPVARLTAADSCTWVRGESGEQYAAHREVYAGEDLLLQRGTAELTFVDGAKVVLEGPVQFRSPSANELFLRTGRIVVRVPQQAIGFTVATSTSRIVDLGTEFAVEADLWGGTEVHVLQGRVELHRQKEDGVLAASSTLLSAGSARRVEILGEADAPMVGEINYQPSRFVRQVGHQAARRIPIGGVLASSNWKPERDEKFLINGHGLNGERHATDPTHTMWHTAMGRVRGEFVSFDLGIVYRLHSMKVWNYNESENGLYKARGIAQANIYVSRKGVGDPLTHPEAWTLAVRGQRFHAATGEESYSRPDMVSLNGVEARFVAIVVDSVLGIDARYPGPDGQCAGLSEVQFFGSPRQRAD